jgi:hypothetical protein
MHVAVRVLICAAGAARLRPSCLAALAPCRKGGASEGSRSSCTFRKVRPVTYRTMFWSQLPSVPWWELGSGVRRWRLRRRLLLRWPPYMPRPPLFVAGCRAPPRLLRSLHRRRPPRMPPLPRTAADRRGSPRATCYVMVCAVLLPSSWSTVPLLRSWGTLCSLVRPTQLAASLPLGCPLVGSPPVALVLVSSAVVRSLWPAVPRCKGAMPYTQCVRC